MDYHNAEWLADLQIRLRAELDDLYSRLEDISSSDSARCGDPETQQRIARILRAYHLIEIGQYGTCQACGDMISMAWLSKYPVSDTCEECGFPLQGNAFVGQT